MFDISIRIANPFSKQTKDRQYFWYYRQITKNRTFEIQLDKWGEVHTFFEIKIDTNFTGSDHAGPRFELTLLNHTFQASLHHHRHWNYKYNRWNTEEDDKLEEERWSKII